MKWIKILQAVVYVGGVIEGAVIAIAKYLQQRKTNK